MAKASASKTYPYPADFVWRFLSDFFTPWHPMMSWCKKLDDRTRKFGMPGEETVYIEQLTSMEPERHRFTYTMLEGISGIDAYRGFASVEHLTERESRVMWEAEIEAPSDIGNRVATGTEVVFNAGLEELEKILAVMSIKTVLIEGDPELAVDTAGKGELLLFLHGIGGNRTNWHGQLDYFAAHFEVAALDFRGYGKSELGSESVTVQAQMDDITRVLARFEADKVHLVGLSYGSWLAACFAHLYPQRIRSLTLCSGSTGMSEASAEERERFAELRLRPIEAGQSPSDIAPAVVQALSGPNSTAASRAALLHSMQTIPRETYIAALRCFLNPPFQIDFEKFDFSMLFVAGEHDQLASPKEMGDVAVRVPIGQLAVVEGAGHLINLETCHGYNHVLQEFLVDCCCSHHHLSAPSL